VKPTDLRDDKSIANGAIEKVRVMVGAAVEDDDVALLTRRIVVEAVGRRALDEDASTCWDLGLDVQEQEKSFAFG
jgi:hypothetical protein